MARLRILDARSGSLSPTDVAEAAEALRAGGLLGFPTETVYGIGASPFDQRAAERVFAVKRRAPDNPLLCHVAGRDQVLQVVSETGAEAEALIRRFWPGPLTLVLAARENIAPAVRAGRPGVGVRAPDHRATIQVMEKAGMPIAGTSANLSGRPAAVRAEDVVAEVGEALDVLIDAGQCRLGIESTVIDLTVRPAIIWRVGAIPPEEIEEALSAAGVSLPVQEASAALGGYVRSRPNLRIVVARSEGRARALAEELDSQGKRVGLLLAGEEPHWMGGLAAGVTLGGEPERRLYTALREAEKLGVEVLVFLQSGDPVMERIGRRLLVAGGEEG